MVSTFPGHFYDITNIMSYRHPQRILRGIRKKGNMSSLENVTKHVTIALVVLLVFDLASFYQDDILPFFLSLELDSKDKNIYFVAIHVKV